MAYQGVKLMAQAATTANGGTTDREVRVSKVAKTSEEIQAGSNSAVEKLHSLVTRIERLNEEKAAVSMDIADLFVEAKSAGFDAKVLRMLIRLRGMDPAAVEEMEERLDTYRHALGDR
jgi:uncharacterized protein (UPF0335 family)